MLLFFFLIWEIFISSFSGLVCILRWIQKILIRVTNVYFIRFKFITGNYQLPRPTLPAFHSLKILNNIYFKLRGEF